MVALMGAGSDLDRALAIACAEAGADLALATTRKTQDEEFAVNSIANEAWALGRGQFVSPVDAHDATEVMAFAEQVWDRYGRCDALIAAHFAEGSAPLDELSPDEWEATVAMNLTAPFIAAHAFGRLMERDGRGVIGSARAARASSAVTAPSSAIRSSTQLRRSSARSGKRNGL